MLQLCSLPLNALNYIGLYFILTSFLAHYYAHKRIYWLQIIASFSRLWYPVPQGVIDDGTLHPLDAFHMQEILFRSCDFIIYSRVSRYNSCWWYLWGILSHKWQVPCSQTLWLPPYQDHIGNYRKTLLNNLVLNHEVETDCYAQSIFYCLAMMTYIGTRYPRAGFQL